MKFNINIYKNHKEKFIRVKSIKKAVIRTLEEQNIKNANINLILTDDYSVKKLNRKYLNHNYETDVLAFSLEEDRIEGEIYISLDTAKRQAEEYKVSLTNELSRLAIHGTLHLTGQSDKTKEEKAEMKKIENEILLKLKA